MIPQLRFIIRDGKKILQYRTLICRVGERLDIINSFLLGCENGYKPTWSEWKDIPIEEVCDE